jgi:hypothetical protein
MYHTYGNLTEIKLVKIYILYEKIGAPPLTYLTKPMQYSLSRSRTIFLKPEPHPESKYVLLEFCSFCKSKMRTGAATASFFLSAPGKEAGLLSK